MLPKNRKIADKHQWSLFKKEVAKYSVVSVESNLNIKQFQSMIGSSQNSVV